MTNLQAAVGCAQMEQLERYVAAKRRIARRYDEALTDLRVSARSPPGLGDQRLLVRWGDREPPAWAT
jgi:dTDP-4-amino-4,6-dideoxygalactose transaminase